jgi:hypothetical protein
VGQQEAENRAPRLLSRPQAAKFCGLHMETFRYHEKKGSIVAAKVEPATGKRWFLDTDLRRFCRLRPRQQPQKSGDIAARAFAMFENGDEDVLVVMGLRLVPDDVATLRARWLALRGHELLTADVARDIREAFEAGGYPTEPAHWPEVVRSLIRAAERLSALDVSMGAQQARPHGEGTGKGRSANGQRAPAKPRGSGGLSAKRNGRSPTTRNSSTRRLK